MKMVFALSLTLAALAFLLSPAMAAASPPRVAPVLSDADRAFIASLAAPAGTPATPVLVAKRPRLGGMEKSLCSATATCESGTVSCEDNTNPANCTGVDRNCSVGEKGHVTCDGVTTWCPTDCCPADWCTYEQDCADSCYPCDYTYTCNATYCTDHCHCRFSSCLP